jgi:hypothetical protein
MQPLAPLATMYLKAPGVPLALTKAPTLTALLGSRVELSGMSARAVLPLKLSAEPK